MRRDGTTVIGTAPTGWEQGGGRTLRANQVGWAVGCNRESVHGVCTEQYASASTACCSGQAQLPRAGAQGQRAPAPRASTRLRFIVCVLAAVHLLHLQQGVDQLILPRIEVFDRPPRARRRVAAR